LAEAEKLDGSAGVVKEVNAVLEGAVAPVELVSPPTFKEVKSSLKIVVCALAIAPIHPAAIRATHHLVNPKFELPRMFFIFFISWDKTSAPRDWQTPPSQYTGSVYAEAHGKPAPVSGNFYEFNVTLW
jgi:hypothetical protein